MRMAMFTNTFLPHVGGVAKSVHQFAEGYRERGHQVLVVAPQYDENEDDGRNVLRLPAVKNFAGSDFSVAFPVSLKLRREIEGFDPDLIHSHHPFLVGDLGMRMAAKYGLPLVFTYHTMYEYYTQYTGVDLPGLDSFAVQLATGYANMCDTVITPSESVRQILQDRGVETSMKVVPTGVELDRFAEGSGRRARECHGVPDDAFVIGHVGRLAPEKNMEFLTRSIAQYLRKNLRSWAVIVGNGSARTTIESILEEEQVEERVCFTGVLKGQELADAYHAFDVFAFGSLTETQGMVLAEALATGCPVVALDAPGSRETVTDRENGRLVPREDEAEFAGALDWVARKNAAEYDELSKCARSSAQPFAMEKCVRKALCLYERILEQDLQPERWENRDLDRLWRRLEREWSLWTNRFRALAKGVERAEQAMS